MDGLLEHLGDRCRHLRLPTDGSRLHLANGAHETLDGLGASGGHAVGLGVVALEVTRRVPELAGVATLD